MITLRAPIDVITIGWPCWKCQRPTVVSSLRAHEVIEDGESVADDARILDAEALPTEIVRAIHQLNPNFRIGYSRIAGMTYWANHCGHCGTLQGDFFLNSEPDGPFFGGQVPDGAVRHTAFDKGQWEAEAGYGY